MPNFDIVLSDLNVNIQHKYDYVRDFCKGYEAQFDTADIVAVADKQAVLAEKQQVASAPIEACECLCIYRAIAEQLPQFDRFVFHGAAIKYDGNAYLFTAPSGTGKTTHINLWRQNLGDMVEIINGDKPIVSLGNSNIVYGTPWAGKEGYQNNISAPVKAICVLKQSKTNSITALQPSEAINHLMQQVYMPQDRDALSKTLGLLGKLIDNVAVYELCCDMSQQAFETSFNKITK